MTEREKEWYIDGSGELVQYPQVYQVDGDDLAAANKLEQYILVQQQTIENSFLKLGAALAVFEDQQLYLAKGLPTMKAWLSGPEFSFSYEHATRLIRIVRDLLPVLGERGQSLPISTMKELLPMLSEGATPEQIQNAVDEVEGLTTRDAKRRIREIRGLEEHEIPTTFRATVTVGETYHRVHITRYGEDGDIYRLTDVPLRIKPKDFNRFADRFGTFIEFETEEDGT